jgi:hypothetical protein
MLTVRFLVGFVIPLIIIFVPIVIVLMISGKTSRTDRPEYIMATLSCFLFGLFGPILATSISTYGLSYGTDPNDPLCATGAGIFIFFGYLVTFVGVPIVGFFRYPPKRELL